jgi:hypothetical protein
MTSKEVLNSFDGIMKSDYGLPLLYLGGLGLAYSDILPTPNVLLANAKLSSLKKSLEENKITENQYNQQVQHSLNTFKNVYYIGVIGTMFFVDGDIYKKAKVGAIILGIGALLGVIMKKPQAIQTPNLEIDIEQPETMQFDASKRKAQRRGRMIKFV